MDKDKLFENYFQNGNNVKDDLDKSIPIKTKETKLSAEGNIDDIDQLGEMLRIITNAAWGMDWGTIKPEISQTATIHSLNFPIITYDINSREVSDKMPIKPTLSEVIQEVVDGKPTGDSILVYRQFFDCIVEFDTWGSNSLEARKTMTNLEKLLNSYGGYLKRMGISEIFFLKEIPSRKSVNYIPGIPMRAMMYYVRLERIHTVRESSIKNINVKVNAYIDDLNKKYQSNIDIYQNNEITYDL